jgi:hypothetical protein
MPCSPCAQINMDLLARMAHEPANATHGGDSPNHAMLNALRMVMNGAISPQELDRVLPEGIVRQVREASLQPGWPPHAHTTHHDAISHAPLQQQHTAQSAVDPMMFWMPPPPHIPAPSHARGSSGLEDLSYHQRSAPQSYRRRTSSERGDVPIPGPSTTRARTRSLGRRASVSSSTTAVHGAPETPVEQEVEDPDEDPDIEEDKRRRNTAASGMHNQDFRLYALANAGTIPIARFRAKKKQQVVRKSFGLPPNRPVLMGAVVFRPRACHIRLVESCR